MKIKKPRANPLKIIMPMPKCLSWRNYEKSLFQSYKAVFMTQNHAKRHFWRKFWPKILPSNLCIENWHRLRQKICFI